MRAELNVGLSPCVTPDSVHRAGSESLDCPDEPHLGGLGALFKHKLFVFSHRGSAVSCLLHPCCWGRKQLLCEENIDGESASVLFSYRAFNLKLSVCLFFVICLVELVHVSTAEVIFRPNCLNAQEEKGIPHRERKKLVFSAKFQAQNGELKCQPTGPKHNL